MAATQLRLDAGVLPLMVTTLTITEGRRIETFDFPLDEDREPVEREILTIEVTDGVGGKVGVACVTMPSPGLFVQYPEMVEAMRKIALRRAFREWVDG